jgi:hypothetical protein
VSKDADSVQLEKHVMDIPKSIDSASGVDVWCAPEHIYLDDAAVGYRAGMLATECGTTQIVTLLDTPNGARSKRALHHLTGAIRSKTRSAV